MPRYQIHITVTDARWLSCDPYICVEIEAANDQVAELHAHVLIASGIDFDVQEIEEIANA